MTVNVKLFENFREDTKQISPGSILSKAMFRCVIKTDCPEIIDYGAGSEP